RGLDDALDLLAGLRVLRVVPEQDADETRAVGALQLDDHGYVGDEVGELGDEGLPGPGPGEDRAAGRDLIPLELRPLTSGAAPGRGPDPAPAARAVLDQQSPLGEALPEAAIALVGAGADLADHGCLVEFHR